MNSHRIITIGREYGSGGRAIGQMLADKLGIKLYDKELISLVAKESGLCEEVLESHDEKPINSFFYSLAMDARAGSFVETSLHQKVFLAQFEAIQKLADREDCIIVGRCADYALAEYPDVTSIFITADMEDKIALITQLSNVTKDKALEMIAKTDKKRASYYNYYSNKKWGAADSYDLCINSSKVGYVGAVETILSFIDNKEKAEKNTY